MLGPPKNGKASKAAPKTLDHKRTIALMERATGRPPLQVTTRQILHGVLWACYALKLLEAEITFCCIFS
jgi:hypothetical protein